MKIYKYQKKDLVVVQNGDGRLQVSRIVFRKKFADYVQYDILTICDSSKNWVQHVAEPAIVTKLPSLKKAKEVAQSFEKMYFAIDMMHNSANRHEISFTENTVKLLKDKYGPKLTKAKVKK